MLSAWLKSAIISFCSAVSNVLVANSCVKSSRFVDVVEEGALDTGTVLGGSDTFASAFACTGF